MKSFIQSLVVFVGTLSICQAAPNPYKWPTYATAQVSIEGKKTGVFPAINASSVAYSVVSPRDAQSGLPTGKRQHHPVTITKVLNEASPLLFNALVTNEVLNSVVIQFIGADKSPGPKITLINASVASFAPRSQAAVSDKPVAGVVTPGFNELEDVSFTFQKIEISYGNNTYGDDWDLGVQ